MYNFKNTKKMKRLVYTLIILLSLSTISYCQDRNFINDQDFIEYIKKELKVYGNVKDKELLIELSKTQADDWDDEKITRLAKAFGLESNELKSHILNQNKMLQKLNNKYGLDQFKSEEISELLIQNPDPFTPPNSVVVNGWGCTALYWACSAAATSMAVLAEVACAALDIETAGRARVIGCYAAVVVGYGAAIMGCQSARDGCEKD